MRKYLVFFVLFSAVLFVVPFAFAEAQLGGPLVPCEGPDCQACHLVKLAQNIINFLVAAGVFVAVLMFVYAGFLYITGGADQGRIKKAHGIFGSVLVGFIIVLAAWLIIDTVMKAFYREGEAGFGPWNNIECISQPEFRALTDDPPGEPSGTRAAASPGDTIPPEVDVPTSEAGELCYGTEGDINATCIDTVTLDETPPRYLYPDSIGTGYEPPPEYIDLDTVDPATHLTEDITIGDLTNREGGRYAYIDPVAVARMQAVIDEIEANGASANITSGYRSPGHNGSIRNAARYSRHMYGDAFDFVPVGMTQSEAGEICRSLGAWVNTNYENHVHCDWRYE